MLKGGELYSDKGACNYETQMFFYWQKGSLLIVSGMRAEHLKGGILAAQRAEKEG